MEQNVAQIAGSRWNIQLGPSGIDRFAKPGWIFECSVEDQCPTCETSLEVCRKPYETSGGKKMKYVALICIVCREVLTMQDLGINGFSQLTPRIEPVTENPEARKPEQPGMGQLPLPGTPEDIIRFWRSVEYFESRDVTLPTFEDLEQGEAAQRFSLSPEVPAPWSRARTDQQPKRTDKVPHYTAYVGLYGLDAMHANLAAVLGEGGVDVDERTPRGTSAMFSIGIDRYGHPDWTSLVVASAPWALGRVIRAQGSGQLNLDGFENVHVELARELAEEFGRQRAMLPGDESLDPVPVTSADLLGMSGRAARFLGITDELSPRDVVVTKQLVAPDDERPPAAGFLNSFLADDLERVAADVARHGANGALRMYLASREPERLDTADPRNRADIEEMLEPRNIPAGRWPTDLGSPMSTSQQLAVNSICRGGSTDGTLFGVNGPPGTGKTTLLRDIVAEQVTRRAAALAKLPDPDAAFTDEYVGWSTASFKFSFPRLNPGVTGWEIIVASSNNGAVENVSRELPRTGELDPRWRGRTYLSNAAKRLDPGFWGLLSGVLGASGKRREFSTKVWWGDEEARGKDPRPVMDREMNERAGREGGTAWDKALADFRDAQAIEHGIRQERQELCEVLQRLPQEHRNLQKIEGNLARAKGRHGELLEHAQGSQKSLDAVESSLLEIQEERRRLLETKPSWWESLWDFGAALRTWRRGTIAHDEQYRRTTRKLQTARECARLANEELSQAVGGVGELEDLRAGQQTRIARAEARCSAARTSLGLCLPDGDWWGDKDAQELRCPWLDAEWNEARSELFLAALALHEAFMVRTWRTFSKGLRAAMALVGSKTPEDVPDEVVTEAWRYLFLMVPVVSTTFASLGRMLQKVSPQSLGWLVIDEAGQATPQAAVGGIWRSRNVVAVGDPLQLEPIVAAMHSTQAQLRDAWDVEDLWMPGRQSVQRLVDRVTPLGTYMPGQAGDLWTGAPLRAHRRCDDPMFTVFNRAVYGGAMVQGPPTRNAREPLRAPELPESAWIEVPGTTAQGKWRPDEGAALVELVRGLLALSRPVPGDSSGQVEAALHASDILVISPFKQVADKARNLLNPSRLSGEGISDGRITAGTVHTAQGKEAKVVILVLGSDPASPGARAWAAEKPNLMNVAVSRAKLRIFVIGQRSEWEHLPYFGALADALQCIPAVELELHLARATRTDASS